MDSPTKRTLIHLFSLKIQYEQVYRENYEKKTNEDRIINIQRLLRDLLDSQIEYKQIPEHK
jgi:ribonuclease PH